MEQTKNNSPSGAAQPAKNQIQEAAPSSVHSGLGKEISGPRSRPSLVNLHQLDPRMEPLAAALIGRATRELGFEIVIIDVLRTPAQQARNIAVGVSWTIDSLHLPQPCCGKSHAIDIVPRHLAALKNWAPAHPDWEKLGALGESLGLKWGGRWRRRDCPHFEWHVPKDATA